MPPKEKKEKRFLQMPEYPGGKKALREFIASQLRYPQDALEQNIQGTVAVAYEVNDEGRVENIRVVKGLFPSCDEEAVRLVGLLRYGKAFNHGVRLKANQKLNIHFRLRKEEKKTFQLQYTCKTLAKTEKEKKTNPSNGYTYSIIIGEQK